MQFVPAASDIKINLVKPGGYFVYQQLLRSEIRKSARRMHFVFCIDLRTESDYFPIQLYVSGSHNHG
jgi:hypothetical protein